MNAAAQRGTAGWAQVLLWVVPLLWCTNYIIARLADGLIAPHALALGRWALAALLLLPWVGRGLWQKRAALRREWLHLLVLGFFGMYICGAWVYVAGHSTSGTNMALIYAATPMAIVAVSSRVLHERMKALPDDRFLAVAGPAASRIRLAADETVLSRIRSTSVPNAIADPALRRFTSAQRPAAAAWSMARLPS